MYVCIPTVRTVKLDMVHLEHTTECVKMQRAVFRMPRWNRYLHNAYREFHVVNAFYTCTQVYGMKDVCLLSGLQHFDMEKGVSVDPMHGIYLGVARLLLGLWLDSCHHKERWYCGTKVTQIDERLTTIRPPHHVNRGPRSLQQRKNWKGTCTLVFKCTCMYTIMCMYKFI